MAVATFDTLKFANTLKAAGVPERQAEAQASAFAEVIQLNLKDLVTKADLEHAVAEVSREIGEVKAELSREIGTLGTDLTREITNLGIELNREIKDSQQQMTSKMDTWMARAQGEITLMRWIMGVVVLGVIGLIARLFIFRSP
jgi:hypothetical protein